MVLPEHFAHRKHKGLEKILVHRSRQIFVFGLLRRHKEDIELTILQMQDALTLARPIIAPAALNLNFQIEA